MEDAAIYRYKSKKLVKVVDLNKLGKIGYHSSVTGISVSGNTVRVKWDVMSYSLGGVKFTLDYKYKKGGKLVRAATKTKVSPWNKNKNWTAKKKISVYKAPNSKKKVRTLKKGQKVKIDMIYINTKYTVSYLHVKTSGGKSGWIKGLKSYPETPLFKEVMYAG